MPSRYSQFIIITLAMLFIWKGDIAVAKINAHPYFEPADTEIRANAPNLFLNAELDSSPCWSNRFPTYAVDGMSSNAGDHWAAENIPVTMILKLTHAQEINLIRFWTYWDDKRYYQYYIETSIDGENWQLLVDKRDNTTPSTSRGELFTFPAVSAKFIKITFTHNSVGDGAGGHIVEIEGYRLPDEKVAELAKAAESWAQVKPGLHGAAGSLDIRYLRNEVPNTTDKTLDATAWRGDRAAGQLLLWTRDGARQVRVTASDLRTASGDVIAAGLVRTRIERYILSDGAIMPDVLDDLERFDMMPASTRPIWVSVDVPRDAKAGDYSGKVYVQAAGGEKLEFDLNLKVLAAELPASKDWKFWLDLWQNPFAAARYHHVELWSDEHWRLMEDNLRLLADAGQKCITTTIIHEPWGTQTYDPYGSMVEWTKRTDGTWSFDYTHFDQYVEFAMGCGITGAINCYSMVPWSSAFRYFDEASGDYITLYANPDAEEYKAHWTPFLKDFVKHLKAKGWLDIATIAMDERPLELMLPTLEFLHSVAPELKTALAGSNEPEFKDKIHDWCAFITPPMDEEIAKERIARGLPTTFYVCCGPYKPNTFTFSPPAESAWQGWYAAAKGYSGFLRWAYDAWVEDPLYDTSFVTWPAGDCFFVYPNGRSSIRLERLREGIAAFEKVRIVREAMAQAGASADVDAQRLNDALKAFDFERVQNEPAEIPVNTATALLNELTVKYIK